MSRSLRRVILALFCCAAVGVAVASLLPAERIAVVSLWDKAEHAIAYATLGLIGGLCFKPGLGLIAGLGLGGGLLEIAQGFTPDRTPSLADEVANIIGATAGVGLAWLVRSVFRRARLLRPADGHAGPR